MRVKTVDIGDDVAAVLRRATIEPRALILNDPEIERSLYVRVDKVLKALGGKWNGGEKAHQFPEGALDQLTAALAGTGQIVDQKRTMQQFFTPPTIADMMAERLGIVDGTHVLEPSAGDGRLVRAAIEHGANITAVEMDPAMLPALVAVGGTRFGWLRVSVADFMAWKPADAPVSVDVFFHEIDAVMMNPPFSGNQDIAHVRRAFEFLRPGGKLAAIMSPHFINAQDRPSREFRDWIGLPFFLGGTIPAGGIGWAGPIDGDPIQSLHVELLPAGTFKAEGTNIAAVLILIEKAGR